TAAPPPCGGGAVPLRRRPGSVAGVLRQERVALDLVERDRLEVKLVVPPAVLDLHHLVLVVPPGAPVRPAVALQPDLDPVRRLVQHVGRDHPAPDVEVPLLLERHLDPALRAVLLPELRL